MATSQVDFANPQLTTVYTDFLDYIRNNINAVAQMNYTGALNIPVGVLQWNDTTKIFEKWGGSSWSEIYTGFPAGFTMLAVQNSAPTGWTRKTLSCQDNAMFCYAKTGNTSYGGSVNPQATHSHDIAGHTHTTTNHQHSMAVHSHTVSSSHTHIINDHTHGAGTLVTTAHNHIWSYYSGGAISYNSGGSAVHIAMGYVDPDYNPHRYAINVGHSLADYMTSTNYTNNATTALTGSTASSGPGATNSASATSSTNSGGTTVTGSAGSDTTSGSNETNTGSNTAPYYQEVIAIEKS